MSKLADRLEKLETLGNNIEQDVKTLAAEIVELKQKLEEGTITAEEEARLDAAVAHFEAIDAAVANPPAPLWTPDS